MAGTVRRRVDWPAHVVLLAGAALVAFPIYVTLVASTLSIGQIQSAPMPLLPGGNGAQTYAQALFAGATLTGTPVWRMLANSVVMALVIAVGKIAISIISAYAI